MTALIALRNIAYFTLLIAVGSVPADASLVTELKYTISGEVIVNGPTSILLGLILAASDWYIAFLLAPFLVSYFALRQTDRLTAARTQARTDHLTGLANRARFEELFTLELDAALRRHAALRARSSST